MAKEHEVGRDDEDRRDGLRIVLRVITSTLPVETVLVVAGPATSPRVIAAHGASTSPGATLKRALAAAEDGAQRASFEPATLVGPKGAVFHIVRLDVGGEPMRLVVAAAAGSATLTEAQRTQLCDLARLTTPYLPRAVAGDPPSIAFDGSFRILFEANPAPMLVVDRTSLRILDVNEASLAFYGYDRARFLTLRLPDIRPEKVPGEIEAMIRRFDDPTLVNTPRLHRTASGEEKIVKVAARALDVDGRSTILASVFDMTEQFRMEQEVRQARAFLREVIDTIPTTVFAKDMMNGGRYVLYNRAGERLLGRDRAAILGRADHELFAPTDAARFAEQDRKVLALGRAGMVVDEETVLTADGTERWFRTRKVAIAGGNDDQPRYVLGVAEDITANRASADRLARMAHYDALTDLPNRFLFKDRLEAALARIGVRDECLALLCIDLDGFKPINDQWGHATGDRLLERVAERLRAGVRPSDTVARWGGDEFVVVQTPVRDATEAAALARRLVASLSRLYSIEGHDLRIGASIGVALAPADGLTAEGLMTMADAALYRSKNLGRKRVSFAGEVPAAILGDGRRRTFAA